MFLPWVAKTSHRPARPCPPLLDHDLAVGGEQQQSIQHLLCNYPPIPHSPPPPPNCSLAGTSSCSPCLPTPSPPFPFPPGASRHRAQGRPPHFTVQYYLCHHPPLPPNRSSAATSSLPPWLPDTPSAFLLPLQALLDTDPEDVLPILYNIVFIIIYPHPALPP
jgi:hypothetical protein